MNVEQEILDLKRKICSLNEILYTTTVPTGTVVGCYKIAINTTNGKFYYKDSAGVWQIVI